MAKKQRKKTTRSASPRYQDISSIVDDSSIKDFDTFIDKLNEFEDSLDGAARKTKHLKDNVTDSANAYKDSFDQLGGLGQKVIKVLRVHADVASDLTTRVNAYRDASFDSIQPEVQKDILERIAKIKKLTDSIERVGLSSKAGMDFLQEYTGRIGGDIAQWVTSGTEFVSKLKGVGLVLAPIVLIVGAIVGAFRLVTGIIKKAIDRLVEVEDASISIRKEFGLTANSAREFTNYINANRETFLALGVSSEQLASNIASAQREFGFIRKTTTSELNLINQLNARLGLTGDATAGVLKLFNLIGNESREVDQNMLLSTIALAEAGKVANAEVFADIKDNSEQIMLYFRGTDAELAQSAIRAKQLGLSLSHVTGFAEKILDFDSSISSEMEASVLLGRQINLDRARRLAFDGDLVGLQGELLNITKRVGDFDQMNVFQRKAVADALGLTVLEMKNMVALETKLSKLSESDRKRFAEMSEEQKSQLSAQKEISSVDITRVKNMGDMQNSMDRIKNTFGALVGNIVSKAQPAIERVMRHVQTLTSEFNKSFNDPVKRKAMVDAFNRIADSVGSLLDKLFKPENLERIVNAVETIIAKSVGVVDWIMNTLGGGTAGGGSMGTLRDRSARTSTGMATVSLNSGNASSINNAGIVAQSGLLASVDRALTKLSDRLDKPLETYLDGKRVSRQLVPSNQA